jgi:uncharacterized integral membrane protein
MAEDPEPQERTLSPKVIVGGVVCVLAFILILQNNDSRQVHAFFWTASMPVWIWLLALFAAGVLVGSVFPWLRRRRKAPEKAEPVDPEL